MSAHAEDVFQRDVCAADQDVGVAAGRSGADSMNAHAEVPLRPTRHGASRGLGVATADRVPAP